MRHFDFLSAEDRSRLFCHAPQDFQASDEPAVLAVALGATLYSPATRPALAQDIVRRTAQGVMSMVVCLEDSIADSELAAAEENALIQLAHYAAMGAAKPLLFVRVRTPEQIPMIAHRLGDDLGVLTGFVLPKFTVVTGTAFLDALTQTSAATGHRLLAMPVLESAEIIHTEQRTVELLGVRELLGRHRDAILAVRLGAADLSSAYGLRRSRDLSVYDIRLIAGVIADVVNVLGRADDTGYVITGPVWEYFSSSERIFKPRLRESPFIQHSERALRAELIAKDLDGLIREIVLDKANGLTGKTVIHPTHVAAVHALSVVSHEEYSDAADILGAQGTGGASASSYGNKMNESKPHLAWARRIHDRARVFGVASESTSFVDLLGAGLHQ